MRIAGWTAIVSAILAGAIATAVAQPAPRPTAKSQPSTGKQSAPQPAPPVQLGSNANTPGGFDAKQRSLVDRMSLYLSSIQTLVGDFVQVGPDGTRTEGQLYVQKPGKVRFEYKPPSVIDVIADGSSVVVRDRKLATQDLYPLSQTPLRFLLSDRIDLLRDTNVVAVRSDDVYVTVVIEERQVLIGTSRLMMMLGAKDYQLKQWTVTDPQGYDTTVAVSNLDTSKRPDPGLFRIDFTRYAQ